MTEVLQRSQGQSHSEIWGSGEWENENEKQMKMNSNEMFMFRYCIQPDITRGQSNLTKGRIVAPKIHDGSALTKPKVVFLNSPRRSDSHETIPVILRPTVTEI